MTGLTYYNLNSSDGSTSTAALGQEINTKGATWVYVKASAAVAAYQVCRIAQDGTIAPSTSTDFGTTRPANVCIPQFAFASGDYGYAPVGPFYLREDDVTTFKVLSKIAVTSVVMYGQSATAGSVDDAVATPIIQGLTLTAACIVDDTATACIATRRLSVNS